MDNITEAIKKEADRQGYKYTPNMKYKSLQNLAKLYRKLAYVVAFIIFITIIAMMNTALSSALHSDFAGGGLAVSIILIVPCTIIAFMTMRGMADGIEVFLEIEKGTTLTNTLLQKILDQSTTAKEQNPVSLTDTNFGDD